jgi:hypothetical protein
MQGSSGFRRRGIWGLGRVRHCLGRECLPPTKYNVLDQSVPVTGNSDDSQLIDSLPKPSEDEICM